MKRANLFASVFFLAMVAMLPVATMDDKYDFELTKVDGVPLLSEHGMPYFTRFTATDHAVLDLSGTWKFKLDPSDQGTAERWFDPAVDDTDWFDHPVPGTWTMQKPEWLEYRGAGWYRLRFTAPAAMAGRFNRLVMDGVHFYSQIYLNGELVGAHQGGYSRFSLDVSDKLKYGAENVLAVRVDDRLEWDTLPARSKSDPDYMGWWPYGGINRQPLLESGPALTTAKLAVTTNHLGDIEGAVVIYNHGAADTEGVVRISLAGLDGVEIAALVKDSVRLSARGVKALRFKANVKGIQPWAPETPGNRYVLTVTVSGPAGPETQSVEIAFRAFEFRGSKAYLNGKPVYLRGMNRHEDFPDTGAVQTDYWIETDIKLLQELHVNFMRMAHYPHDPRWLDACDRAGIMIVHEVPNYWAGGPRESVAAIRGERYLANASRQLVETIERDRNHPSVVMWSVGNENRTYKPSVAAYHRKLCNLARSLDPARPITFAINNVPLLELAAGYADVIFVNEYFGWYVGATRDTGPFLDQLHLRFPNKPIVVSEFGAGAVPGIPGTEVFMPAVVPQTFTEENQVRFHEEQLKIILSKPYITGLMPWIFADFRDRSRPPHHPVRYYNLKGLVTQKRVKKASFALFEKTYAELERTR